MTFAEFKAKYEVLAAYEDACYIARDRSMQRSPLGYRISGTESHESVQVLRDATTAIADLLKSVGMDEHERMWSGCGEDVTVEALEWMEKLLAGLER